MKRMFSRAGLSAAQLGLFLLAMGAVTALRAVEVTWDGSGDRNWTQPDATSWSGATYQNGDTATFAGAGQGTVTLSGTITPGGVTVSAGAYTFSGTAIGGGGLTLSGVGTFVTLGVANTYAGDTVVGAGSTLRVGGANRLPSGAGKGGVAVDGTLSLAPGSHTLNALSGAGTVLLTGESWESGTLTLGGNNASSAFAGTISNTVSLLNLTKTGSGTNSLNGSVRYRGLTTINGGMLTLGASNTLSGTVTVNAGGTLRLGHPQALWRSPLIIVVGGATLDTTEMAAAYSLTNAQTLRVGGRGVTSTLVTSAGNGLTLRSTAALHINAYDGSTPALTASGDGYLTLASNNAVTVTVAGATPLAVGDYTLVSGGMADVTPPVYVTVNGAGRAAATTAALIVDEGDLILRIADYSPGRSPASIATAAAGPWDSPATWQGGSVPGPGDSVTLNHAVTLLCGTPPLASFSNNTTLTFNGWNAPLVADSVIVNATVTHLAQSATAPDPVTGTWVPDNRVWIVCTNLMVNATKVIDCEGKGYNGVSGPGRSSANYSGGSYGGAGQGADVSTYGSATAPVDPGSGGRGTSVTDPGGAGGGVVRITASGAVTLHGTISAKGGPPPAVVGCGSGGSIYITCKTLTGGGVVSANGGTSANTYCGGGGGGRITVMYDTAAQEALPPPAITIDANGGRGGDLGTLYFPDNRFLTSPMRHCGQWMAPGLTGWTCDSLVFSNASLRIPVPGFTLDVAGDWTMTGAGDTRNYGLHATDAQIACGGSIAIAGCTMRLATDGVTAPSLTAGGDLSLQKAGTMASALYLYAARTNGGPNNCGMPVTVGGTFTIATNCTVYLHSHGDNGGSVRFSVGSLLLAAGGLIDANARGYNGLKGPGASLSQSGASYGGRGAGGKVPYGCEQWPQDPGSGGGQSVMRGGGLVVIEAANRMTIDGTIRATGADGGTWTSAASGGGVALRCKWLSGSGAVSATGGTSVHDWTRGAGGRIAIWRLYDNTTGLSNNVAAARGGLPAENGTVFWGQLNAPGTVLLVR